MRFPISYTLKQIAKIINSDYVGADDFSVLGMNEIQALGNVASLKFYRGDLIRSGNSAEGKNLCEDGGDTGIAFD